MESFFIGNMLKNYVENSESSQEKISMGVQMIKRNQNATTLFMLVDFLIAD